MWFTFKFKTILFILIAYILMDVSLNSEFILNGSQVFTNQFYAHVSKNNEGNFVTCPFSTELSLILLAFGANGTTLLELMSSLAVTVDNITKIKYQKLIDNLNNAEGVTLKIRNNLFVNDRFRLKKEFSSLAKTIFRSSVEEIDFSNNIEAMNIINSRVAIDTNKKIKQLFNTTLDNFDETIVSIIFTNVVYFKGKWKEKFLLYKPRLPNFLSGSKIYSVPVMYQKRVLLLHGVLPELKASFVEVPYEGEEVSMLIFLPDEINGLKKMEKTMEKFALEDMRKNGTKTLVRLRLPRFKVKTTIQVKDVLQEMGIKTLFSKSANFSGISDSKTFVSDAVQKSFIEVDENSAESIATTGYLWSSVSFFFPKEFNVNRPFHFKIIQRLSDGNRIVFFAGNIVNFEQAQID